MIWYDGYCIDSVIYAVIIAHILMWGMKVLVKGIRKLWKWVQRKREERFTNRIKCMMDQMKK